MQKNKLNKILTFIFIILVIAVSAINLFLRHLPTEIKIIEGREQKLELKVPITFQLFCKEPLLVNGYNAKDRLKINLNQPLIIESPNMGTYDLEFRLMGIIPVKKMKVQVLPEMHVIPGGHSLGVKLRPNGVIVVGFASIIDENGQKYQPAQEAGIQIGDTIVMVNNRKIYQAEELSSI
ncbi:MAG: SpoIVB peptidase, partial [Tepidanaerobacteraceae bacterium]|nr:SpoIVB peptidase [Tepidanaerobacteraceae bacterium]